MKKRFTITEDHLKLLKNMWTSWDDTEFGAPQIDPKRPYGNSSVYEDIAGIIGLKIPDFDKDEEWSKADLDAMNQLHQEMETVLQIGVRLLEFRVGDYECEEYSADWKRKERK